MLAGLGLWMATWTAWAGQKLNVFIWSEYIDPAVVTEFEQRFDAEVTLDLFEDADAMLAKMQGGGAAVYDVVVPSDYAVKSLVQLKLLAPLRHERIPNLKHLDPRFRGLPFDPKNAHTVAYQWGTMGLYYRKVAGKPAPDSWGAVFDPARQPGPMVLMDSMRDTMGAALKFQGHSLNTTDLSVLKATRGLLMDAKKRCVGFDGTVGGKNRVVSKGAELAVVFSGDAVRGMAEDPETAYVIPKEGSELAIDNLAVSARAPNRDLAEAFINFVLEPRVGARISNYTQFGTPNAAARAFLEAKDLNNPAIYPPAEVLSKLEVVEDLGMKTRLYDEIWSQVKAD